MKGATIFSGGEGIGMGMRMAGIDHAWGIEYDDKIAEVSRKNGFDVKTQDLLECDPHDLESVDIFHASPPCPNFSNAKTGGEETENDIALSQKVCEFIEVLQPKIVTLENVYAYRNSQSWKRIAQTLFDCGYTFTYSHINMADYGVPQTRRRMIVIAWKKSAMPTFPAATHAQDPKPGLFGTMKKWVSWYEAIEDLIPSLPDSELADWQKARLPEDLREIMALLVHPNDQNFGNVVKSQDDPSFTCRVAGGSFYPRAVIFSPCNTGLERARERDVIESIRPMATIPAQQGGGYPRAVIFGNNYSEELKSRSADEPMSTVVTMNAGGYPRAILFDENSHSFKRADPEKDLIPDHVPSRSVLACNPTPRFITSTRVVQMTPRALARLQSFPDDYILPETKTLSARIIGNSVPPLFYKKLITHLIEKYESTN